MDLESGNPVLCQIVLTYIVSHELGWSLIFKTAQVMVFLHLKH